MPERVQVYTGVLVLSMRCTRPSLSRGFKEHNYLVLFFLPRRLPVLAANFRFGDFVPRFLLLVFAGLNLRALLA